MKIKHKYNIVPSYLLLAAAIIVLVCSVVGFAHSSWHNHRTSFSLKVTSKALIIEATYDPAQALQVEKYIDSCLQPEIVFGNRHHVNKDVQISSIQLKYHIKASPGTMKMTARKYINAESSLIKLKNMLEGLRGVIKPT